MKQRCGWCHELRVIADGEGFCEGCKSRIETASLANQKHLALVESGDYNVECDTEDERKRNRRAIKNKLALAGSVPDCRPRPKEKIT